MENLWKERYESCSETLKMTRLKYHDIQGRINLFLEAYEKLKNEGDFIFFINGLIF